MCITSCTVTAKHVGMTVRVCVFNASNSSCVVWLMYICVCMDMWISFPLEFKMPTLDV